MFKLMAVEKHLILRLINISGFWKRVGYILCVCLINLGGLGSVENYIISFTITNDLQG